MATRAPSSRAMSHSPTKQSMQQKLEPQHSKNKGPRGRESPPATASTNSARPATTAESAATNTACAAAACGLRSALLAQPCDVLVPEQQGYEDGTDHGHHEQGHYQHLNRHGVGHGSVAQNGIIHHLDVAGNSRLQHACLQRGLHGVCHLGVLAFVQIHRFPAHCQDPQWSLPVGR